MIVETAGPQLGYSELVELYGEELGFSIGKTLRKTKSAVKSVAKVVAKPVVKAARVVKRNAGNIAVAAAVVPTGGLSLLAKKNVQKAAVKAGGVVARNAGNIAVIASAVPTGGLSLLAKKNVRNVVGTAARATQKAVVRPVAHVAATAARSAARSPLVQKAAGTAFRSFVPGGALALDAASSFQKMTAKKKNIPMPAALKPAPVQRSASGQVGQYRGPRSSSAPAAPAAAEAPASSFPIVPVAIGGAGLLLVLAMSMGKRK